MMAVMKMTILLCLENMENYKGQQENFMGSVGYKGAVKYVTEIVEVSKLFFSRELTDMIVRETNRYAGQLLCRHKLSIRLPARAQKRMTGRTILYCVEPLLCNDRRDGQMYQGRFWATAQ
jgi:hypothetical protein